jgi:hypothetical protein
MPMKRGARRTVSTVRVARGLQRRPLEAVIANHLGHHGLSTLQNYADVRFLIIEYTATGASS